MSVIWENVKELIPKREWPEHKLEAIRAKHKAQLGREFPFIDGRTLQSMQWVKEYNLKDIAEEYLKSYDQTFYTK